MSDVHETRKLRRVLAQVRDGALTPDDLKRVNLLNEVPAEIAPNADAWPELFATYNELVEAPEPQPVIQQIMCSGEITIVGAPPKHGKTCFLLSMAKALLSGDSFLNHFAVPMPAKRVLYLVPEAGLAQAKKRLVLMRLMQYVNPGNEGGQRRWR
jgi:RecA-family ATPase